MSGRFIEIRGARTHCLKDLSLDIPREAWTVVCGVSGSGKSSLVLDTLGAEAQRRFLGTLSRGLAAGEALPRPDVDRIEGLPPAVATGFLSRSPGPRVTLGTVTEIHDGLRALFARAAIPHCPSCGASIEAVAPERVIASLVDLPPGTKVVLLAPRGLGPKALDAARRDGFVRVRIGARAVERIEDLDRSAAGTDELVAVVVDRLVARPDARTRFADSVEQGFRLGGGVLRALIDDAAAAGGAREIVFADRPFCGACGVTYPALSPALFSFNSPAGACPACEGLGSVARLDPEAALPRSMRIRQASKRLMAALPKDDRPIARHAISGAVDDAGLRFDDRVSSLPEKARKALLGVVDAKGAAKGKRRGILSMLLASKRWTRFASFSECAACSGSRLAPFPSAARLDGATLPELLGTPVAALRARLAAIDLTGSTGAVARPAREDVLSRLAFLDEVGLGYLTPSRSAATLSGGELRRAHLAAACAARMSGLLFLLDEPTAGLHPADRGPLRRRLRALVTEGSTVVCVEHDPQVLREADHIIELGPGAGAEGGRILAEGPVAEVIAAGVSPLARALHRGGAVPTNRPRPTGEAIRVIGARFRNLKRVSASFPIGALTCVTGVSGAGKSTLVLDVLAPAVEAELDRAPCPPGRLDAIEGLGGIDRVSVSDGAPSRHPRATPGSVLGALDPVRGLFAATVEARARGWLATRFSANVAGGRCEACAGTGSRVARLRHLADVEVTCDVCEGRRFTRETLEIRVKGLSIADVLDLPISKSAEVFRDLRGVGRPLEAAADVGLGYVPLGEPTSRLSGGEALRLRLAAALGRGGRTRTLYLLDEPCAGLHPDDVAHLAKVLLRLAAEGNAVVTVEHHRDLVRLADHVVDLGPGPGDAGGEIVVEGTPAEVLACGRSATGRSLAW